MADCNCDYTPPEILPCMNCRRRAAAQIDDDTRLGKTSGEIRDEIISQVGMMADARTPEMQARYDAALAREMMSAHWYEHKRHVSPHLRTEPDRMFEVAMLILRSVRLFGADEESRWHEEVVGKCHVWGDFYGPATSKHLARAIAHRFMDRQGGDLAHLEDAWRRYGAGAGGER